MSKKRTTLFAATILCASLALAGCSASKPMDGTGGMNHDSAAPSASSTIFNDHDVTFVHEMIPHHEQAVEMSRLLLEQPSVDTRVAELARSITAAQAPEIVLMNSWLKEWNAPKGSMSGMDHGKSGMMSGSDMAQLKSARGTEAARIYLTGMTAHHEGAVAMAETEISTGKNAAAIALAKTIVNSQKAEIATMRDILATL